MIVESAVIVRGTIVAIALLIGGGSVYWLGKDNKVEETAEVVIKEQTGFDIDITPFSPEKSGLSTKEDKNGNK